MNNNLMNELYKTIEAKDKIINEQVLEIAQLQQENKQLKEKIKKVIKCIKNQYYEKEYRTKGTFVNKLMVILGDKKQ